MSATLSIYSLEEAKQGILKRQSLDVFEVPESILERLAEMFGERVSPEEAVRRILASVRDGGDAAVKDWTARIDGAELAGLAIPEAEILASLERIPAEVREALEMAARRIEDFHRRQISRLASWQDDDGLGQLLQPVARIGVYVPGGTAPLPSSLLMSAIPALVAGSSEVTVCTPPGRDANPIPDVILAAAAVCGIKKIYQVGGAQAIGAMAYGTESIPQVDMIVGPGNLFVTLAKRQVFGVVGIDGLPGPTETMVVADDSADPAMVAADLLAQAEHDVLASAILVTTSRELAEKVAVEVTAQTEKLSRADIIQQSLAGQGGVVLVKDLATAMEVANEYAAEHLCLTVEKPDLWLEKVRNAGGVFLGEHSFEVLGDYVAGPSHVMPTGGTARFASPLNVLDFLKVTSIIGLDKSLSDELSRAAAILARAEALTAHAASAEFRVEE